MKIIILGSGGCVALPKPLCKCKVCTEAREKGRPYSRFGCSIFLDDIKLLVDTPEDITQALNSLDIDKVNTVLYSHLDPDHTLGMRVFEHLRLNWLEISEGKECTNPINVLAMPHVMDDLNCICSKYGPFLDYYENIRNLINRQTVKDYIYLGDIKISFIQASSAAIFVFEHEDKKVIYAPCDVKPFPENKIFEHADLLIIGNTIIGETLKDGVVLSEDNIMRNELFSVKEVLQLKDKYQIHKVIFTHLEEDWGKSYDDYIELEKQYDNIQFAYDGMSIEV